MWPRFAVCGVEDYSGKSTCVILQNGNDQHHAQPIALYYVSPAAYMEQTAHRKHNSCAPTYSNFETIWHIGTNAYMENRRTFATPTSA